MASNDEIVDVLGKSIIAAAQAVKDGKPQAGLDMIDIVVAALPAEGLEVVELAALPTKIVALANLGKADDARAILVRLENLAATHGTTDDLAACKLLRDLIKRGVGSSLAARGMAAMRAVEEGDVSGLVELEQVANEAIAAERWEIVIGAYSLLGKAYGGAGQPERGRTYLLRAKALLEELRPLDDARHAIAIEQIEKALAALPTSA